VGKQNLAMFERAMRMFTPFAPPEIGGKPESGSGTGSGPVTEAAIQRARQESEKAIEDLQKRLEELQKQLVTIGKTKPERSEPE